MSKEAFSRVAERYDRWYQEHEEIFNRELECLRKGVKGKRILEIGSGTGAFAKELGAVALDPALGALKIGKAKGLESVLGVAEKLPFRSKAFDCSYFVTSLCFVDSVEDAIKEAERVSKEVVACIIPKESDVAKLYEEKGRKGHELYKYAHFLSKKRLLEMGFNIVCDLEWFTCLKK
ncbi:hypothetical protein EYM_04390 [Ignicoccus islandicus DSM 13165]|uniref:Methyltransferase type 11 domain-containing protein n=1 Tax=Ignicoccus islandicus DSM 13165 TaxID=940295 RepID=A0A0U3F7Z8_9CREN|nr:methyltransferase domain-containing protein [Ignicoccus islandicus]ALU11753.1 hypothetical protein EYM_04390 [Ignicoccus islandicus DSM 13165]